MNPTTPQSSGSAGRVFAMTGVVVLVLLLAGSLYFNFDRSRQVGRNEVLQAELSRARDRIQELESSAAAGRLAREQAEEKASGERIARQAAEAAAAAAGTAERQAREELARQRQDALETAQALESEIRESRQRLGTAEETRRRVEEELAREMDRRENAEQRLAEASAEVLQQREMLDALQGRPGPRSATPAASRSAGAAVVPSGTESAPATAVAADRSYDTAPKPVALAAPEYPLEMKQNALEGSVLLSFTVDDTGRVRDVVVEESSRRGFERAAVAAVREWRFEPARRDGRPVECRLTQRLVFSLD